MARVRLLQADRQPLIGFVGSGLQYPSELGKTCQSGCPVYLSAVSSQGAFHPEGELPTARAAGTRSALFMLSNSASTTVEPVTEARGGPVWMQLYPTGD